VAIWHAQNTSYSDDMARSTHIIERRYGTLNTHHTVTIWHTQHTSYTEDTARSTHIIQWRYGTLNTHHTHS